MQLLFVHQVIASRACEQDVYTLAAIGRRYGVSTAELSRANGLESSKIRVGQALTIPQRGASSVALSAASPAYRKH